MNCCASCFKTNLWPLPSQSARGRCYVCGTFTQCFEVEAGFKAEAERAATEARITLFMSAAQKIGAAVKRPSVLPVVALDDAGYLIWKCPGCELYHSARIVPGNKEPVWKWNGDGVEPTLEPSVNVTYYNVPEGETCHFFLREGVVQFLGDCSHAKKGTSIKLKPE